MKINNLTKGDLLILNVRAQFGVILTFFDELFAIHNKFIRFFGLPNEYQINDDAIDYCIDHKK